LFTCIHKQQHSCFSIMIQTLICRQTDRQIDRHTQDIRQPPAWPTISAVSCHARREHTAHSSVWVWTLTWRRECPFPPPGPSPGSATRHSHHPLHPGSISYKGHLTLHWTVHWVKSCIILIKESCGLIQCFKLLTSLKVLG